MFESDKSHFSKLKSLERFSRTGEVVDENDAVIKFP